MCGRDCVRRMCATGAARCCTVVTISPQFASLPKSFPVRKSKMCFSASAGAAMLASKAEQPADTSFIAVETRMIAEKRW